MKTVVIGASHWHTKRHIEGFRSAGCEIVGVEDANLGLAQAIAGPLGANAYDDIDAMLDREKPAFALRPGIAKKNTNRSLRHRSFPHQACPCIIFLVAAARPRRQIRGDAADGLSGNPWLVHALFV